MLVLIGICTTAGEQSSQAYAIRARASTCTSTGASSCWFLFPVDVYAQSVFFPHGCEF